MSRYIFVLCGFLPYLSICLSVSEGRSVLQAPVVFFQDARTLVGPYIMLLVLTFVVMKITYFAVWCLAPKLLGRRN